MKRQLTWLMLFLVFFLSGSYTEAGEKDNAQPIRILCLGDSITQSGGEHCGYRYFLWKKMIDHHMEFDFIGSMNKRFREEPGSDCPPYNGKTFDPDHEGHWAWRADDILGGPQNLPPESGKGYLSEWLKEYTPDIVLLHLGHNDAGHSESPEQTAGELKQIIRLLQTDNPEVSVLLAKVIPCANPEWNAKVRLLNAEIDGIAADTRTATSDVVVMDFSTGFDPFQDTLDGTHPNASGSEKMAAKWFDGIRKLLENPKPGKAENQK
ncbi:MAG: cellulose-binding protein [Desulfobacteraceae bacterium]|nr:MAG: cellulose-binding protein [Desulfobacteraceae bacterium]